ncbi:substrate binding domain-containing protein, partial [Halomonas sp. BM-2019]|uniref:substrate binding domain-containing protein n=1 Tax=Halomonas sp. BM-2019 TaxID=2811227 RepID=UPI0031FBFF9C
MRISAPVSFAIRHLAPLLNDFQRAHPAVGIDLQLNDRKVDIVEEGFDIALRIGRLKSSSLIARRIAPVRLVLCASPDYLEAHGTPEHPQELAGHRFLRYRYMEESQEPLLKWLSRSGSGGREGGELISNNGDVLVEAAMGGAGI